MPTALKNHRPVRTRSPFFINCVPNTGTTITSASLSVKIKNGSRESAVAGNTLKTYTLSKTNAVDNIIVFDIAPLASDFLDHQYDQDIKYGSFIRLVQQVSLDSTRQYLTANISTSSFCNLKVGDKWYVTTPAFTGSGEAPCNSSFTEETWDVTVSSFNSSSIVFDYGQANNVFFCMTTTSSTVNSIVFSHNNSAQADEVLFIEVNQTIVVSGGDDPTPPDEYYTANFGYGGFKDGVNFLPSSGGSGAYGYVQWTPTVNKQDDVTIMATDCYRQMGQNSYTILPIFTGEFDRNNPDVPTRGRIKFGAGELGPAPNYDNVEKWLWFQPNVSSSVTVNNIFDIEILPSDYMLDKVEQSVTYLPIGKKNLCNNWIDGFDFLRVGHFVSREDLGSPYETAQNDLASVNAQGVLRYEIICEPKYEVIDCLFINKFGFWDSFSFFKKSMTQMSTTESKYKRNIGKVVNNAYTYNTQGSQKLRYNTNGFKSIIVNTGFVNESFSLLLEEILLSESIVLIIDNVFTPVTIQTNQVDFKKSVNDKMINYTLTFDFAYNELNDVV